MKAVLDTNVLVSGLISASGPPGRIVDLLRTGALVCVVDDRILAEYSDVLRRPELSRYFTGTDADHILEYLERCAERVVVDFSIDGLPDPDDAPFLEAAVASGAFLVTGNLRHFPEQLRREATVEAPVHFLQRFVR
jgi:uncharacterized protein